MITKIKLTPLILISFLYFGLTVSAESPFEVFTPPKKISEDSSGPILGQLQPVNQINLMEGYHLIDADLRYGQWSGDLPYDPRYRLARIENIKSQETSAGIRYAYGLFRFTYLGLDLAYLQRNEADFNYNQGPVDPNFFIGQHFPWENGNIRLSLNASPSLGKNTQSMSLSDSGQTYSGNALRGGYKVTPAAAVYSRLGPVIVGSEASYSYFGNRELETDNSDSRVNTYQQGQAYNYSNIYSNQNSYMTIPGNNTYSNTITHQFISGGNILGLRLNLELPKWQRLGVEWMYEQIQSRHVELDSGTTYNTESYNQNKIRTYARIKLNNQMSLIPEINWTQAPPNGSITTNNNQDTWAFGLLIRSKFN